MPNPSIHNPCFPFPHCAWVTVMLLFSSIPSTLYAQEGQPILNRKIDSILVLTEKALNGYRFEPNSSTYEKLIQYKNHFSILAKVSGDRATQGKLHRVRGKIEAYANKDLTRGIQELEEALKIYQDLGDTLNHIRVRCTMAQIHDFYNEKSTALGTLNDLFGKYRDFDPHLTFTMYAQLVRITVGNFEISDSRRSGMIHEIDKMREVFLTRGDDDSYIDASFWLAFLEKDVQKSEVYLDNVSIFKLNLFQELRRDKIRYRNLWEAGKEEEALKVMEARMETFVPLFQNKTDLSDPLGLKYMYYGFLDALLGYHLAMGNWDAMRTLVKHYVPDLDPGRITYNFEDFSKHMAQLEAHEGNYAKAHAYLENYVDHKNDLLEQNKEIHVNNKKVEQAMALNAIQNRNLLEAKQSKSLALRQQNVFLAALLFALVLFSWLWVKLYKSLKTNRKGQIKIATLNDSLRLGIEKEKTIQDKTKTKGEDFKKLLQLTQKMLFTKVFRESIYLDFVGSLSKDLEKLTESRDRVGKTDLTLIRNKIRQFQREWRIWDSVRAQFEVISPHFFKVLLERFPKLSVNDLKHSSYVVLDMDVKAVSRMLDVSKESVEMARFRLKNKLGQESEPEMEAFLRGLHEKSNMSIP